MGLDLGSTEADIATYALCGLGAVFGLIFCFAGYRLWRPILFVTGFIIAAGVLCLTLFEHTGLKDLEIIAIALIGGIIIGTLTIYLIKLGIFALGASLGLLLFASIISVKDGGLVSHDIVYYMALGAFPFTLGVLALCAEHYIMIVATSFAGAFSLMATLDHFSKGGLSKVVPAIIKNHPDEIEADVKTYAELAGIFVLFLAGLYVQTQHTAKDYHHKEREDEYEYRAINSA
mmetsp:Transcript_6245/g.8703  ORF Transcript_6245/g.8703 Transcript_6245/m.8703 type:complete len:232 (-) Transcript_6245:48-743(-)